MVADSIGLAAVIAFILLAASLAPYSRLHPRVRWLLYVALALRVIGAGIYLYITVSYYNAGDAVLYFERGREYAVRLWSADFSMFFEPEEWHAGRRWGTQLIFFLSGVVLSLIGPTMTGEFIVFSLLSFLGLVGFGVAFHRSYPHVPVARYLRWIWLFPSLWFWPSAVGKEAVILFGLGLAIAGYVGSRRGRISWPLFMLGLLLVFGVRPQVAAVLVLCIILERLLARQEHWTLSRTVQTVVIAAVGFWLIHTATEYIGIGGLDVEATQDYLVTRSETSSRGGSAVDEAREGWASVPAALLNILFRPFPWEASNAVAVLSSLEIWSFWLLVWLRRRTVLPGLHSWRSDRFRRLAVVFMVLYAALLGLAASNLGIVARQRIFLFPFLFLFFEVSAAKRGSGVRSVSAGTRQGAGHTAKQPITLLQE